MHFDSLINKGKPVDEYMLAVPVIGRNKGTSLNKQIQATYKQKQLEQLECQIGMAVRTAYDTLQ